MLDFEKVVGEEVFIATEIEEGVVADIFLFRNISDLHKHLLSINLDSATILHGYLNQAKFLPSKLNNRSIFIIIKDDIIDNKGIIYEFEENKIELLEQEIGEILDGKTCLMLGCTYEPEIEQVYILYGYEVPLKLTVSEADLDEEAIETCKKLSSEVDNLKIG